MDKELFKQKVYMKYENETNQKKKTRHLKLYLLQNVATLFLIITFTLTAYAKISGNTNLEKVGLLKIGANYEENATSVNKSFENDYLQMTLESIAGDGAYIVVDYIITFNEKALTEFKSIEYDSRFGFNLTFDKKVFINSKQTSYVMENINKLSDVQYRYTQVINVMDITDNTLNLEVDLNSLYIGNYQEGFDEIVIKKKIKTQIAHAIKDFETVDSIEQVVNDNVKYIIEGVKNTKFENFIRIKKITENVTWKEYEKSNDMQYNSFIVTNENNQQINAIVYTGNLAGKTYYIQKNSEYVLKELLDVEADIENQKIKEKNSELGITSYSCNGYSIKDNDLVKVEENYIILLRMEQDIDKINLIPTNTYITNEKREVFNNTTWYPIISGNKKYIQKSNIGGELEINNIEITDENVVFYYEKRGIIENGALVVIRKNNGTMNYVYATSEEVKGVNSTENKIIFERNNPIRSGLNVSAVNFNDLDNLEFALLFGIQTEIIGDSITLNTSTQDIKIDKIDNTQIIEIE